MQAFPIPKSVPYKLCGVWGDPRAGGARVHQGVDLCCAAGTPLLAVSAGVLRFGPDPLGGNTATLTIADGSHYYYAHLSAYEGEAPRAVLAGQVIGYCGSSGDAQATLPHLHFGHYVAGKATNPLAELQAATHVDPSGEGAIPWLALAAIGGSIVLGAGAAAWAVRE